MANLIFFLPGLKELHESVSFFYKARLHTADLSEGQDGFKSSLHLAGRPESTTGCGESVVHQPVLVLNHLLEDGRLTLDPARHTQGALRAFSINFEQQNVNDNLRVREQF